MKANKNKSQINVLYKTHIDNIINREDQNYLKLFENFNDLISNIHNDNLRSNILFSYIKIESLLFNYISRTSENFYEFGFNDLKSILFSNSKINNNKKIN